MLVLIASLASPLYAGETIDPNLIIALHYDKKTENNGTLSNETLKFELVKKGTEIPLNSIIVMPASRGGKNGFLSISFKRSDVNEQFINDFFYNRNPLIRSVHPFSYQQIEPVLYNDKLVLNIHDGIIMHIRSDIDSPDNYYTFSANNVMGRVIGVRGAVYHSKDHKDIKRLLKNFFVTWGISLVPNSVGTETKSLLEGGIQMSKNIEKNAIPRNYEPLIVIIEE